MAGGECDTDEEEGRAGRDRSEAAGGRPTADEALHEQGDPKQPERRGRDETKVRVPWHGRFLVAHGRHGRDSRSAQRRRRRQRRGEA